MKRLLTAVALLALLVPSLGQAAVINLTDTDDLAAEVVSAAPNDQLILADGTYTLSSTLTINKALTITGQSETGVILDCSASAGYGIRVIASDVTLEYFTIDPPAVNYPIHASGTSNPPNGFDNLTIQYVTVEGTHQRTGFDIHGYNNVVLSHLTSKDATGGNGLQVTGCVGVTIDNFVNQNNAWGCIAVYCSNSTSYLGRGSDNVVIDGNTVTTDDPRIFSQDEFGLVNTNVSVTGYDHNVWNDTFRADAAGFTFFLDTQADATAFALGFTGYEDASSIQRISDGHWVVASGMSIQTAIDDAMAGGTVEVLAGTFVEQLEIAKDLSLLGSGMGTTVVQAFASMPLSFMTSAANTPVVWAHDADAVVIRDLTVDGAGFGNSNYRFYGIAYRNAGGGVYDCEIRDVRNDPLDGSQHGNAFYLYNNDTVARSMDVHNCDVYGFQKNGITLNSLDSTPLTVDVVGNVVTGATGLTADNGDPAQNGVQLWGDLITGQVDGNTITSIAYDNTNAGTKWVATSILDYYSQADVTNNLISQGHVGVYKYDAAGQISGNDMTIEKIGVYAWGIIATDPPQAIPQPFAEADGKAGAVSKALLNVTVDGNTVAFSGIDNTATYGIEGDAGYGPDNIALTVTNNTVTGFEAGVDIWQCQSGCDTGVFTSVDVNQNNFSGNTYGVRSNVGYLTVDASCNWYGDISGPATTTNAGTGDAVEGDVVYTPWLDAAAPSGACTQVGGTVAANPSGEISDCNPCLVVPIEFDRTNIEDLRGVSITFQLSSELELCSGVGDIQEATGVGSLFEGFTNTQLFVIDNGGGSYTADLSLLGTPCGTATGGTALLVGVTSAAGIVTDTTGTITVTSVTARDCANAPLPAAPGAPASVTINNGAPAAVADLSASQLKTGNDSNGTTKINLSWTDPGDPDLQTIEIYRKGFGFYPEYDDAGGSVPAAPADPVTAVGAGWTHVASVTAGTGAYADEPNDRDFWYYVVFAHDGCNDGAVSNRTGGTLNYHLGDIAPTPTGNNLVLTGDVSALGAAYGTVDGDGDYNPAADVGPTTDFFVNARPTTDDQIQFEDLMMFAINYNQVSKRPADLASAGRSDLELMVPSLPAVGETFEVSLVLAGDGSVHGLSADVSWNDEQVEYLGFAPGELMSRQGTYAPVFSIEPGLIDAAVFGTEQGILGEGTLATLRFEVRKAGEAGFGLKGVDARNADNEEASLGSSVVSGAPGAATTARVTQLLPNVPNPFNPATEIRFVVGQKGPVSVQIYSLQGRLVRTLAAGPMDAGEQSITWHGRDDSGRSVASGTYVVRVDGPDRTHTRNIVLLK